MKKSAAKTSKKPQPKAKGPTCPLLDLINLHESVKGRMKDNDRIAFSTLEQTLRQFHPPSYCAKLQTLAAASKTQYRVTAESFYSLMQTAYSEGVYCFGTAGGDLIRRSYSEVLTLKLDPLVFLTTKGVAMWATLMRISHREVMQGRTTISPLLTAQLVGLNFSNETITVDYLEKKKTNHVNELPDEEAEEELQTGARSDAQAHISAPPQPQLGVGVDGDAQRCSPSARPSDLEGKVSRVAEGGQH